MSDNREISDINELKASLREGLKVFQLNVIIRYLPGMFTKFFSCIWSTKILVKGLGNLF